MYFWTFLHIKGTKNAKVKDKTKILKNNQKNGTLILILNKFMIKSNKKVEGMYVSSTFCIFKGVWYNIVVLNDLIKVDENGIISYAGWVEWKHVPTGIIHCPICLVLDKCWFNNILKPNYHNMKSVIV